MQAASQTDVAAGPASGPGGGAALVFRSIRLPAPGPMSSSASNWYYVQRGERAGPHTLDQMRALLAEGGLTGETLVWTTGMAQWLPAAGLPILFEPVAVEAPAEEAPAPPPAERPRAMPAAAHAWSRFLARLVDILPMSAVVFVLAGVDEQALRAGTIPTLLPLLPPLLWIPVEALLISLVGTTPGKALFALRVETQEGVPPSFPVALSRSVRVWVQGLGLNLPLLNLLAEALGYTRLTRTGSTAWDDALALRVGQGRIGPVRALAIAALVVTLALSAGAFMQLAAGGG